VLLLRSAWAGGVTTLLRLVMLVPAPVRRPVAHWFAGVLQSWAARRRRSSRASPIAFVALWAADRRAEAAALAATAGTSPGSAAGARRRLAVLARTAGLNDAAAAVAASVPDDRSADLEALRSRIAYDEGRYTDALAHAQTALAGGMPGAGELRDRASGYLTVLRPGWVPEIPAPSARARQAAAPIRGRVLHVVRSSLPHTQAGYTIRTQSVATCQREAGLDPHVMTRAGYPRSEGVRGAPMEEQVGAIAYHRVAPRYVDDGRLDRLAEATARAALPLAETLRPAVLQPATNHVQAQVALALGRNLGIPVVYEVRGFWEETWLALPGRDEATAMEAERYRLTRDTETAAMIAADAVVTLSETMRQEIVERGCAPDRVVVVPNAVDVERFAPVSRDDALAASLGLEPADFVAGYVSTLTRYEGIPYLLEAAARLRGAGPRLRVLLVGDGPETEAIVETGRRLGLDDGTLLMPGRVPHDAILGYYSLIDVFVVPRTADRVSRLVTPLKPYEAMALERALVVSDLPALREIVVPGETGRTFRAQDPDDLARVLGELRDDPAQRTRLGRQAREWIVAERTWSRNGLRYRDLFERLGVA
jgi:glycosyltransferase involved in cell wall biosynthesis